MWVFVFLTACALGIAALARGRGGNPTLFGSLVVAGYFLGWIAGQSFGTESVIPLVLPWAMVGLVAFATRFILGAGKPKPDSMWSCPNCNMVNESSYVVCQACQRPWTPA